MLFHDTNLVNYKKLKHIHTSLVFSMNTVHSTCILLISNIYNAFFDKITYCQVGRSIFYFLLDLKRALGWTIYFGDSIWRNGILFPKLFWPTVRKSCSTDREKLRKNRKIFEITKGQIISECPHEIIVYPKIATKIFLGFLSWKFTTSRLVQNRVYLLANRT